MPMPRLLPIIAVAIGGVLAVNALAGARNLPDMLSATKAFAEDAVAHQRPEATDAVRITKREQEVMQLITDGLDNKTIAQRLGVAGDTVKSHVRNILEKLTLHSRLAIAAHSRRSDAARPNFSGWATGRAPVRWCASGRLRERVFSGRGCLA